MAMTAAWRWKPSTVDAFGIGNQLCYIEFVTMRGTAANRDTPRVLLERGATDV